MANTIINYAKAHNKLWMILSHNPNWEKNFALAKFGIDSDIIWNNCFACESLIKKGKPYAILCYFCPLKWPNNFICANHDGLYSKWNKEKNLGSRQVYARRIANLKWTGRRWFSIQIKPEFIKFWRD